jgi:hypothetical protein
MQPGGVFHHRVIGLFRRKNNFGISPYTQRVINTVTLRVFGQDLPYPLAQWGE